ncbi:MAG: hypothetical protein IT382_14955 [Deltaproteobacteria bacterium]|nr:hypothetical protein [Deltaproteobacteria bacterium]
MGINGTASVDSVTTIKGVSVNLTDAGEIRRLGRILLAFLNDDVASARGPKTDAFARDLVAALGFNAANTAK